MKITFYKYQGTGNDFIMFNNMDKTHSFTAEQISFLCDRKLGIGADGLISIEPDSKADFYVNYYNSDGTQSFCGNGSRCSVAFANAQKIISESQCTFNAIDGIHSGEISDEGIVSVSMGDVNGIEFIGDSAVLDTGSPHYVTRCNALKELDIIAEAHKIRYNSRFSEKGVNINFVFETKDLLEVRTYERGVENETLSCGTGVTAVALSSVSKDGVYVKNILTQGGLLKVSFERKGELSSSVKLTGPAKFVYKGIAFLKD